MSKKLFIWILLSYTIYIEFCSSSNEIDQVIENQVDEKNDCGCSATSRAKGEKVVVSTTTPTYDQNLGFATGLARRLTNRMSLIEGGTFTMGSDNPIILADGEGPARVVTVNKFWMDLHEVSNLEFAAFVNDTHYVTEVSKWERTIV